VSLFKLAFAFAERGLKLAKAGCGVRWGGVRDNWNVGILDVTRQIWNSERE
jgi:hypothetical protein